MKRALNQDVVVWKSGGIEEFLLLDNIYMIVNYDADEGVIPDNKGMVDYVEEKNTA